MKTMRQIHNELGMNVCRQCINKEYNTNITRNDCCYISDYGKQSCSCCGELRNIVVELRIKGRLKLFFK